MVNVREKNLKNALYDSLETLTRLSRAVGIHLIMGIQRPDSTVVSGQIKNNVSFRICGRFVDKEPSRIMLDNTLASELPNIKGRFLVKGNTIKEVQSFYFIPDSSYYQDCSPQKVQNQEKKHYQKSEKNETKLKNKNSISKFDFDDLK